MSISTVSRARAGGKPVTIVSGVLVVSFLPLLVEMIEVLVILIFPGLLPVPEVPPVQD